MPPFEKQLAPGLDQLPFKSWLGNFRDVEDVTAPERFLREQSEISRDDFNRLGLRPETRELRMARVATGFPAQNFLRQQPFPPGGHEPFSVEMARMDSPEAHPEWQTP